MDIIWASLGDTVGHFGRLAFATAVAFLAVVVGWAGTLRTWRERREAVARRAHVAAQTHPSQWRDTEPGVWAPQPAADAQDTRRAA